MLRGTVRASSTTRTRSCASSGLTDPISHALPEELSNHEGKCCVNAGSRPVEWWGCSQTNKRDNDAMSMQIWRLAYVLQYKENKSQPGAEAQYQCDTS